ncbi:recombinase family protein [Flavobacterium chungangensis]|uniref:Recombinase family protein n=1 Tax=Flavobacterium chungangensis TaxID=2708132 RepID=A0ABV8ZHP1_9FLAO
MAKVCVYARVSTVDKQDYTRQISDCKAAIGGKYNENDIEIFAERISGYKENEKRPELQRLLNIINSDPKYFDSIYITEISRLGRDPKSTRLLIDDLTEKKIPIFITSINRSTLDDNLERDSIMNIILQVLIEFSDSESRTMKRRSKSGILQSVVNGGAGGSKNLPFGYTKDESKKLVVDFEESEIIKEIFQLYKEGNGVKKIATILNERKVMTRANKAFGNQIIKFKTEKNGSDILWSDKTILDIVKNPLYKGKRRFKGNLYDAPAIISSELFDECNDLLTTKTHRNYLTTYDYLLKDLCTCAICGRNYFAKFKPVPRGDKVYICSSRLNRGGNCGNVGVNIDYLESSLFDMLKQSDQLMSMIDDSGEMKEKISADIKLLKNDRLLLEKNLKDQNKKESRLLDLYLNGSVSIDKYDLHLGEIKNESTTIASKLNLLNRRIVEQKVLFEKLGNKDELNRLIKNLSQNRGDIAKVFKQFIKQIYIFKTSIDKEILIDVHMNYGEGSFKLMLDLNVMKYKKPNYNYRVIGKDLQLSYDEKGVLKSSEKDIYEYFGTGIGKYKWEVLGENYLVLKGNNENNEKKHTNRL